MVRITDLTFRSMNAASMPVEPLREFYALLVQIGADFVEVDAAAADRLGEALIPARTALRLRPGDSAPLGFARYVCRAGTAAGPAPLTQEVRVNDTKELVLLSRHDACPSLRVTGLPDLLLHDFRRVFARLRREAPGSVELCPTDDCGCASALLTEWLLEDGNGAGAFAGAGGYAPLEETLLALRMTRKYQRHSDLSALPRARDLYERLTGTEISPHKAVLGKDIFAVESGVHVDGVLKNAANYEPYPPELVGERRRIAVGKHSGRGSLRYALAQLEQTTVAENLDALLEAVRRQAVVLHRSLTDGELLALARETGAVT